METSIDEQIKVWVMFDPSTSSGQVSISPIAMNWQRRLIKFTKLIFVGSKKIGQVKIVNLVCASGTANFELEYNTDNNLWRLKKVMPIG